MLSSFIRAYIVSALWSSTDDNDTPLDCNYDETDITPSTLEKITQDCTTFYNQYSHLFTNEHRLYVSNARTPTEYAAYDFWLTRNHHGSGFWDGDWDEPYATILANASHAFPECDFYVGDDGKLYL